MRSSSLSSWFLVLRTFQNQNRPDGRGGSEEEENLLLLLGLGVDVPQHVDVREVYPELAQQSRHPARNKQFSPPEGSRHPNISQFNQSSASMGDWFRSGDPVLENQDHQRIHEAAKQVEPESSRLCCSLGRVTQNLLSLLWVSKSGSAGLDLRLIRPQIREEPQLQTHRTTFHRAVDLQSC